MVKHVQAREVEDGVLWADRAEGVTAIDIAAGSPGAGAGIRPGDVLIALDGMPIRSHAEVIDIHHRGYQGSRQSYLLLRLGTQDAVEVALAPATNGSSMY